jgi:hypothetical protein
MQGVLDACTKHAYLASVDAHSEPRHSSILGTPGQAHFCEAIASLDLVLSLQQVQALFATLDVFGDGVLHKEELMMVLDLDQAISPLAVFRDEGGVACTTEQDDKGTKEEELQKTEHEVAAKTQDRKDDHLL